MVKTFQTTLWCWHNVSLGNSLMTSRFVQKIHGFTPWDYLSEEIPSRGTTLRLTGYPEELWSMFFFITPGRVGHFLHIKLHVFEFELYVWETPIVLGSRLHVPQFTGKVAEEKSSILAKVTQEEQGIPNSSSLQQPSIPFAFRGVHVHLWACMCTPHPPVC